MYMPEDLDSTTMKVMKTYQVHQSAGLMVMMLVLHRKLEGNTYDSCELIIEGHELYCPDNPDDPACTDFLHNVSNKKPLAPKSGSVCDGPSYHPGCPQIVSPERYCLVTDDPIFCKTIGDIYDANGFVKPEVAYCTR